MIIDLFVDLNTEDETGLPWTYLDQATDPTKIAVGATVRVGAGDAACFAEIVDISSDGIVHVRPLPAPSAGTGLAGSISHR